MQAEEGEPPVEDILASIRRILNDDESEIPPQVYQLQESMLVENPQTAPETREKPELTDTLSHGTEPASLLTPETATATAGSLGALRRAVADRHTSLGRNGITLEDMVREELRPILKQWLDSHLPELVERVVRAEVARLSGQE